ncbi:MAG TPA: APC family permease [Steroidobacteraceae bacterium]|nr:APC family permease [Steroidobacteraceae bacterium]
MTQPLPQLRRSLGALDLVLMSVAAIISFRWLSIAAQIGPSSLTLWVLGLLSFFLPSALTVLELSSRLPGEGGIYLWSKAAFGELHAFVVGWCYWVSNLVFFPSLLLFIAAVFLYVKGGSWLDLAGSPRFNAAVCLGVLWFATLLNVMGLNRAKWLQNVGGIATWLAGATIFAGGALAWHRLGSATHFTRGAWLPDFTSLRTLASFATMALAYVGLELGPIVGGEIQNPRRTIARAVLVSCLIVPVLYIAGTAALLVALPAGEINLISGIPQALAAVGGRLGLPAFGAVTAALVALSQVGTLGAWVAGTARLPFLFGLDRYMPRALGAVHPRFGSPYVALVTQGTITTLILLAALSGSAIHEAFLVLIDMSIILGFIPLIYMFAALPVLRARAQGVPAEGSPLPRGLAVCRLVAASGIAVTVLGAIVAMIPPTHSANPALIALKVVGGSILLIGIGLAFFFRDRLLPDNSFLRPRNVEPED